MTTERTYEELFYTTKNYEMSFLYESESLRCGRFYKESRYEAARFIRDNHDQYLDVNDYIMANACWSIS